MGSVDQFVEMSSSMCIGSIFAVKVKSKKYNNVIFLIVLNEPKLNNLTPFSVRDIDQTLVNLIAHICLNFNLNLRHST